MKCIFAADTMFGFGKNGQIPWSVPDDIAFFKRTTIGHTVVMGRVTWESLSRRPLPRRHNIVISRNPDFKPEGATVLDHLPTGDFFVIGGVGLLEEAVRRPDCEGVFLTTILGAYACDLSARQLVEFVRNSGEYAWDHTVETGDKHIVDYFRRRHVQKS